MEPCAPISIGDMSEQERAVWFREFLADLDMSSLKETAMDEKLSAYEKEI